MTVDNDKILEIAHGYTQRRITLNTFPKVELGVWNYSQIKNDGDSTSKVYLRTEDDVAIVGDGKEEDRWKIGDLILGVAVKEAQGFVMFQPSLSVKDAIHSMLSATGHGYGFLTKEGNYLR